MKLVYKMSLFYKNRYGTEKEIDAFCAIICDIADRKVYSTKVDTINVIPVFLPAELKQQGLGIEFTKIELKYRIASMARQYDFDTYQNSDLQGKKILLMECLIGALREIHKKIGFDIDAFEKDVLEFIEKGGDPVDYTKWVGSVSAPEKTAFLMPKSPDKFVEGASGSCEEPTLDKVQFHLEKALRDKEEHVILNLSFPGINFIQAARITRGKDRGKMTLQASVFHKQRMHYVLLQKACDDNECRAAFQLYFEKGDVLDLETFSIVEMM